MIVFIMLLITAFYGFVVYHVVAGSIEHGEPFRWPTVLGVSYFAAPVLAMWAF